MSPGKWERLAFFSYAIGEDSNPFLWDRSDYHMNHCMIFEAKPQMSFPRC